MSKNAPRSPAYLQAMPAPVEEEEYRGLIPTLNKMGFMTPELDPYSKAFVEFATRAPGPLLEIGAAYGLAVSQVLAQGVHIKANDIDRRHLDILFERVPLAQRKYLDLIPGSFPDEINLEENTYGAILASRVFHFFDPEQLCRAAAALFRYLAPNGKVFIVSDSPYQMPAIRHGRSIDFEQRTREGKPWPGFFDDVHEKNPTAKDFLPKSIHLLDPLVLSRVLKEAGFTIEKAEWIDRPDYPKGLRASGKENVGVVGFKKM
jgi:SAM-dependent methyltransferase